MHKEKNPECPALRTGLRTVYGESKEEKKNEFNFHFSLK